MSGSTLLLLRHDISAANLWINNKLNQLKSDEGRASHSKGVDVALDKKCVDIENIISDSKNYFSHHRNQDPILKLSVEKLVKSWQVLTSLASNRISPRPPVEPLNLSYINDDSESVSSYASAESNIIYTPRFDAKDCPNSARGRRFIPHLTPLYRAVIRAKVRSRGRRSAGSSTPSSLSVSPVASAEPSPNRYHYVAASDSTNTKETEITIRKTVLTQTVTRKRSPAVVTLDLSDSEPEFEPFPWVSVSDDEHQLDDIYWSEKKKKNKQKGSARKRAETNLSNQTAQQAPQQEAFEPMHKPSEPATAQQNVDPPSEPDSSATPPEPVSHSTPKSKDEYVETTTPNWQPAKPFSGYADRLPQTTKPLGGNSQGLLRVSSKPQSTKPAVGHLSEDLSSSNDSATDVIPKPGFALYSTLHIVPENDKSSGSSLSVEIPEIKYGGEKYRREKTTKNRSAEPKPKTCASKDENDPQRSAEVKHDKPAKPVTNKNQSSVSESSHQQSGKVVGPEIEDILAAYPKSYKNPKPLIPVTMSKLENKDKCPEECVSRKQKEETEQPTTSDAGNLQPLDETLSNKTNEKDTEVHDEEQYVPNFMTSTNKDSKSKEPNQSPEDEEKEIDRRKQHHGNHEYYKQMPDILEEGFVSQTPESRDVVDARPITRETVWVYSQRPKDKLKPSPRYTTTNFITSESEDERDYPTDEEDEDSQNEQSDGLDLSPSPYKNPPQDFSKTYRLDFTPIDEADLPTDKKRAIKGIRKSTSLVSSKPENTNKANADPPNAPVSVESQPKNALPVTEKIGNTTGPMSHSPARTTSTGYNSGFTDELETPDITPRSSKSISFEDNPDTQIQGFDENQEQVDHCESRVKQQVTSEQDREGTATELRKRNLVTADSEVEVKTEVKIEEEKERSSWWTRVLLWMLFIFFLMLWIPFLALFPACCDNTQYHCGVYGFRRKYTAIPPH